MLSRRICLIVAALIAAAVLPSAAAADSIVYMKSGQVWVADAAGQNAHQVTRYDFHWRWPSMADDGTIVAAGGPGHGADGEAGSDLYVFSGDGNLAHGPIPTPGDYSTLSCPTYAPFNVRISPDASKIAYSSTLCSQDMTALWTPSTATGLDWPRQDNGLGTQGYDDPVWTDSSHFLASHVGTTLTADQARWYVHDTGVDTSTSESGWSESDAADASSHAPDTTGEQAAMSRDGSRLAILEDDQGDWIPAEPHNEAIWLYTVSGGALTWQCTIPLDVTKMASPFYASPTFSPDGSKLMWGDDDGVKVLAVGDLASGCAGHSAPVLLVPDGYEPFYAKGNLQAEAADPAQPGAPPTVPTPGSSSSPGPSPSPSPSPTATVLTPHASFRVVTKTAKRRKGKRIAFDASKSHETGGKLVSYRWKFGDKKTGKGRKPTHAFRRKGTYKVVLTVIDAAGHRATYSVKVKIKG